MRDIVRAHGGRVELAARDRRRARAAGADRAPGRARADRLSRRRVSLQAGGPELEDDDVGAAGVLVLVPGGTGTVTVVLAGVLGDGGGVVQDGAGFT